MAVPVRVKKSASKSLSGNKNGLFCSHRDARARERERFNGFLFPAGDPWNNGLKDGAAFAEVITPNKSDMRAKILSLFSSADSRRRVGQWEPGHPVFHGQRHDNSIKHIRITISKLTPGNPSGKNPLTDIRVYAVPADSIRK